ncbi:hypothetical protein HMPREF1022_03263 [Desulfovibrio sp. 6_1_46AFAA]|uniref:hypothetical protein n=1 Tax=Desulfovibrio sp. 6_1_46AFAA TaxID=665942 RepID=UPI000223732A|nr:hypothetical protein [Desulfovibrio sp. 6_1_46AFAA]EGW49746.1 hypothetical protein HMPREF1022_03263 [Desulfovibrio sp. 6_1_46AFAA]
MAKNDKPKRNRYTSPKGEALFASVVNVDYGTEQYPNPKGGYKLTLALESAAADKLRGMLAEEIDMARNIAEDKFRELKPATRKKLGNMTFNELGVEEYDKDDQPTGRILFRFKTSAFYEKRDGTKMQRKVPLFDSMMQPVLLKEEPGNGSLVRVAFTCAPYFVEGQGAGGLSLYLDAVQIIKLNLFGGRSASDYGFGEEDVDGGFNAADVKGDEAAQATPSEDSADDDDGDVPF